MLISDYGSGLVTPAFASPSARGDAPARWIRPVLIDTRYRLLGYRGLTACTPNESEVEQALGVRINDDRRVLEKAGRAVLEADAHAGGADHARQPRHGVVRARQATLHIPIFGSDEIADVTGAGDTVMATMTLALAAGGSFESAARLANYAGGLVVMKRGTATVSAEELKAAVARPKPVSGRSLAPAQSASAKRRRRWPRSSPDKRSSRMPPPPAPRDGRLRWPTAASTCFTWATFAISTAARGSRSAGGGRQRR